MYIYIYLYICIYSIFIYDLYYSQSFIAQIVDKADLGQIPLYLWLSLDCGVICLASDWGIQFRGTRVPRNWSAHFCLLNSEIPKILTTYVAYLRFGRLKKTKNMPRVIFLYIFLYTSYWRCLPELLRGIKGLFLWWRRFRINGGLNVWCMVVCK